MSIKIGIGKLKPFGNFPDVVKQHVTSKGLELLQIKPEHLDSLVNLPQHHRDPFDRLLIAQAIYEDIPILTDDSLFSNYPIKKLEL
jgi:PIN domain nuclease of toxin-antitoxin system